MLLSRDGRPVGEQLYLRVTDARKIQKIKCRSVNWVVGDIVGSNGYIILEQQDAYGKSTGYCRIIKKDRAIVDKRFLRNPDVFAKDPDKDWMYYERRG